MVVCRCAVHPAVVQVVVCRFAVHAAVVQVVVCRCAVHTTVVQVVVCRSAVHTTVVQVVVCRCSVHAAVLQMVVCRYLSYILFRSVMSVLKVVLPSPSLFGCQHWIFLEEISSFNCILFRLTSSEC
jgi:hypothetical protein